jgi:hypothetical protein
MTEIRPLLTRALLTGVFTSLYSARKTCIWESMPGMESTGLPRSLSPNGLSEYKTKSSNLGFANASSIEGSKPKLQLWNWINWGTCAVLICYQGDEEIHRGTDRESDQVLCFDEGLALSKPFDLGLPFTGWSLPKLKERPAALFVAIQTNFDF